MITTLGAILLPLCLIFWQNPARLLELVFIGSAFAAAAAIVIGGFGVAPGLVPCAIFTGFFLLKLIFGVRYPGERAVLAVLAPFILVVLGAIASSYFLPRLFEGEILVWPQKSTLVAYTPLAPNAGNFTQDMYLIVNAVFTVAATIYLTRPGFDLRRLLDAYLVSGLMVVFISIWQFAGNTVGIWFPTQFFLSNPGWAELSDESIGTLIRINGPFSEPSALAAYLCGSVGCAGWLIFNGDKGRLPRAMLICGLLTILLSTSTTGYAALAVMGGMLGVAAVVAGTPALRKRVAAGLAALIALVCIGFVTIPAVAPGVAAQIVTITNATLNKQQSSSYEDRTAADRDSVNEMKESYYLGVGWGSNRSSSLIPGLCASVGAWGLAGFAWFIWNITASVRAAHRVARSPDLRLVMHGCAAAILGDLTADILSAPTISSPDFYLLIAILIATATRLRYEAVTAGNVAPVSYAERLRQPVKSTS